MINFPSLSLAVHSQLMMFTQLSVIGVTSIFVVECMKSLILQAKQTLFIRTCLLLAAVCTLSSFSLYCFCYLSYFPKVRENFNIHLKEGDLDFDYYYIFLIN